MSQTGSIDCAAKHLKLAGFIIAAVMLLMVATSALGFFSSSVNRTAYEKLEERTRDTELNLGQLTSKLDIQLGNLERTMSEIKQLLKERRIEK
jgi:tRNA nucleotidyltransferase (CCA-adding enzyme)